MIVAKRQQPLPIAKATFAGGSEKTSHTLNLYLSCRLLIYYTKNNPITLFNPDISNIISYTTIHIKYITLIIKNEYKNIKKYKNQYPRMRQSQTLVNN